MGQIIGIVVAKSKSIAQRAARSVKVTYNKLHAVLTIEVKFNYQSVHVIKDYMNFYIGCYSRRYVLSA